MSSKGLFFKDLIDTNETHLLEKYPEVLNALLIDKTTGHNLLWCTDDYEFLEDGYRYGDEILAELITVGNEGILKSRCMKDKETQIKRVRNKGEVFTPSWICNKMNNMVDESWFGRKNVFNIEKDKTWARTTGLIEFPDKKPSQPKSWQHYVKETRLEITCGEAPFLVSRYDMVVGGEIIPPLNRIGLLDRKLIVIHQRTKRNNPKNWIRWANIALQSVYGYDWQGDNVILARENLLMDVIAFYQLKFGDDPKKDVVQQWADIIAWNIWQMDGLKFVVPNSCHPVPKSTGMFTDDENVAPIMEPCPGCVKSDVMKHSGTYCKVMDWSCGQPVRFVDVLKKKE